MARAVITIKLLPETADIDLKKIELEAKRIIEEKGGEVGRVNEVPIAFGLRALEIIFIIDESLGSDVFETALKEMEGVSSATVTDFRRALG